ncbi:UNVERIFIED_CONTAM: hypothetical protein Slati_3919400 [Sesamum latifolium]|uniref:Uncharacterized protein n=1 Tax=Sesamum latifolium TaxID=2727402 RepID=A0AAW2TMH1_9LAMI
MAERGDRNAGFFHAKASQRHQSKYIRRLRKTDGTRTDSAEGSSSALWNISKRCSHLAIPSRMIFRAIRSISPL